MGFTEIIDNTAALVEALGFKQADNRTPAEQQAEGGRDRRYQISAQPIGEVLPRLGIPDNIRDTGVLIRLAYARGGGDAGGPQAGGDRLNVNARGMDDGLLLAARLEDPAFYDSQVTGIRRRLLETGRGVQRSGDLPKAELWDLALRVEWEALEDSRAVAS